MAFAWLQQIAITPTGMQIAYTVRRPLKNDYQVDCFIHDRQQGETIQCSTGTGQASFPTWSRDGSRLAYVWWGDGDHRIKIVSAAGSESDVHRLPEDLSPADLDWSPDGRHLAFTAWSREQPAPNGMAAGAFGLLPSVRVVRRLRYKQDGAGWVQNGYRQVWLLDVITGAVSQLTSESLDFSQPRWNWGGDRLAVVATAREQNRPLGYGQVVLCDGKTGGIDRLIPDWAGASRSPQWQADDSAIVFAGHRHPPPVHRRIFHHVWQYDLAGGQVSELSGEIDQTVGNYATSDQRAGLTNVTVQWPDGRGRIYFLLTEQGATHLYSADETGRTRLEIGGQGVVFQFAAAGQGAVAYGWADPRSVGELYCRDEVGEGADRRPLTALNGWLRRRALTKPEEFWYEGLEQTRVHAWEYRPVKFEPTKRYPAVVYVHCSMFSWDFSHELQCLAAAGFVVFLFNQRGTTAGYGQAHALGNYYGKQAAEFDEIMRGVDEISRRPYVDPDRLGVTGGSCGGFLTNWIIGHTDRFRGAVTQRSVTDLLSKFGTSDNGPEQAVSEGGMTPWTHGADLWRASPIAYAPSIDTPLLIIHSDEDHRCDLSQAESLFAALRWLGKEVQLVVFEGESHGLSHGGRPGNRIERLRLILGWFKEHLKNYGN